MSTAKSEIQKALMALYGHLKPEQVQALETKLKNYQVEVDLQLSNLKTELLASKTAVDDLTNRCQLLNQANIDMAIELHKKPNEVKQVQYKPLNLISESQMVELCELAGVKNATISSRSVKHICYQSIDKSLSLEVRGTLLYAENGIVKELSKEIKNKIFAKIQEWGYTSVK